ncbi:hypothetical protein MMC22_007461 [Lobaria immixta]|nr:hypothetical protein [Lobaria immixta]
MKTFTISAAVALLAALAHAAPAPTATPSATITFAAAAASYTKVFPLDGSVQPINNDLSVDHITCPAHVDCTFRGIDGSVTRCDSITVSTTVVVAPPQAQVSGTCSAI